MEYDLSDVEVRNRAVVVACNFLNAAAKEELVFAPTFKEMAQTFFCSDTGVCEAFLRAFLAGNVKQVEFLPESTIVKIGEWND